MLVTPNNAEHADQYLDANLPQIGVVNGGHEEPLGNVIEVSRIPHCWSLGTPAIVFREGSKVLVVQFAFPSIQARVVGRPSVKVTRIKIPSLWGQEVAYSTSPLDT